MAYEDYGTVPGVSSSIAGSQRFNAYRGTTLDPSVPRNKAYVTPSAGAVPAAGAVPTGMAVQDQPPYPTQFRQGYDAATAAVANPYAKEGYQIPSNQAAVEENYGQYKTREAARMAQASQPVNYPGVETMSALSMTNARVADGGDADTNEQRRINMARAGRAGWMGLLTSGGAQRALNVRRQQDIARGHLGVEQGRLAFDSDKYWQGERPLMQEKLGIEGRQVGIEGGKLRLEERRAAADIWTKNQINALRQAGRYDEAAQLEREHKAVKPDVHAFPNPVGGGTLVLDPGTEHEVVRQYEGMLSPKKP